MMVRAIILFLLVIVVMGMVANALLPGGIAGRLSGGRGKTCPQCGRPRIGKGPCDCARRRAS